MVKWAVKAEIRRLEISIAALRRALPSGPQPANRRTEQLVIESSPLLTGEREEIALLDDKTRALLGSRDARVAVGVLVRPGPQPATGGFVVAIVGDVRRCAVVAFQTEASGS